MKLLLAAPAALACTVSGFTVNTQPLPLRSIAKYGSSTPLSATQLSMGIKTEIVKATSKLGVRNTAVIAATAAVGTAFVKLVLDKPSREYESGSVAKEYDGWTEDGILEYYWGEHIHLGYYTDEE